MQLSCWKCAESIKLLGGERIRSRETCPRCGADLHCCRNCRFYDPAAHNQCREPQAEWVREKDRANYCDYFEPVAATDLTRRSGPSAQDIRKKFDALFQK